MALVFYAKDEKRVLLLRGRKFFFPGNKMNNSGFSCIVPFQTGSNRIFAENVHEP